MRLFVRVLAIFAIVVVAHSSVHAAEPQAKSTPPAAAPTAAIQSLAVFPPEINLAGPRSSQRIVVVGKYADGRSWDLTRRTTWASSAPQVAEIADGIVRPTADGEAKVAVQAGGLTSHVTVKVKNARTETAVDFSTEIAPLLSKLGCNQGACHGAQHGRGGFKLSLLGYDPEFDHAQIVKSAEGRRVVLSDPERSILLMKPTLTMEHGGGERMQVGSWQYERLKQWLEDGTPEPKPTDPIVASLQVFPSKRVMLAGEEQQLVVQATWSDGRVEDATSLCRFDSLNDSLASVTPNGLVRSLDRGETHVMIRYGGQAVVFQATMPFASIPSYPEFPRNNFIDEHLLSHWKSLGVTPSELCTDAEFLRRISLDTIGTLPTLDEVRGFLVDLDVRKREKAVDRVLERPEFIDYWTLKWGDLLKNHRSKLQEKGMWSFHNWIRASLRDGKPVDEFVRDIITAEGSTYIEGPANFYLIGGTPSDWAETTSQVFLGVRMQCAKCHHHPFEKWSQDDYYSLAAFYARMGTKNSLEFGLFGRERVVFLRSSGEGSHPKKGIVKPRPLDGQVMDDPFDRRRKLADWLTSKDNLLFSRNIVNRFWGYYFGRGLVEPLDDMRATNPASNPELLDALAKDFAANGFNLKHLLRTIMNSRAYQLSSAGTPGNQIDNQNIFLCRHTVRRLTAEQMADAVDYATGTQQKYQGVPLGTRAIQLPDPGVQSFFLDVFGRPPRQITCECERQMSPNIAQALHLMNGDFVNAKITKSDGRIAKSLASNKPLPDIVDELYLATLCRPPRAEEMQTALTLMAQAPTPKGGAEDLLWALLNSREFLFNH